MSQLTNNYPEILAGLKEKIRSARQRAALKVNVELLSVYWEVGNTILEQQKDEGWGTKVIKRLSTDLRIEFPDMKGFSERNLKYMRAFAEAYPDFLIVQPRAAQSEISENQQGSIVQVELAQLGESTQSEIVQGMLAQLSWYHHITLLDKVKEKETRLFYILETVQNGWSRDIMVHQIESNLYARKGKVLSNFKNTIAPDKSELVQQLFKDPYKFEFIYLGAEAKERDLEDALTHQLTKFLLELGQYFAFMGRQYKMMLNEREYFFDLLFYHTRLKRYIVIDLKIDEFKPEYKGKMEFYLNLADEHLKQAEDEDSIGLILCKTKDGLVAEYSLRDSTKPIGIAEYKINELLPENIRGELPSIEELEAEIEKEYEELKSPTQKKMETLKEKLAKLKVNEVKVTATSEILFDIIDKSLIPFYKVLLLRMEEFKNWFVSSSSFWDAREGNIKDVNEVAEQWKNEDFLRSRYDFNLYFSMHGFKKAGTDAFNISWQLNFKTDTYWYGFILINYNKNQPILKKLYDEQLTETDIEFTVDTICNYMIEDIDRRVENLNDEHK